MKEGLWAIGIDVGGTKVEGSLIHQSGAIEATKRIPSPQENGPMLQAIVDLAHALKSNKTLAGIGFSIPGSLDPQSGILRNAPNSPAINGTLLAQDLSQRLHEPLAFANDADCLAMSEHRFGSWGKSSIAGIILGTGIGVGVVHNGKRFQGFRGLAPEPGHFPLDIHGRPCLCGNKGCVEAYLSGPSILKRYKEAGGESQTTLEIFQKNREDPVAARIVDETMALFARFIATLVSAYDPEIFVLGGGLSKQPLFYEQNDLISQYCFGANQAPPIVAARAGDASGKLGAASLIFDKFENA